MSNEAGQGTITMPAAAAECDDPCEQGIISAVGVFLDTIVICTLSGFVVIMAHCWSGNEAAQWEALDKLGKFNASVAQLTPGTAMNILCSLEGLELGNLWAFSDLGNILIVFANIPILYRGAGYVIKATKHYKAADGTPFTSATIGSEELYWDGKE